MDNFEVVAESQRLAVIASAAIQRVMAAARLRRGEVADKLGVPRSRVSKVLDGGTNMTLKTLAQFGLACDVRWELVGVKADDPAAVVWAPETLGSRSPCVVYARRTSDVSPAASTAAAAVADATPEPLAA